MKEFWNQRYNEKEYVYGTSPNVYFKECLDKLKPGKLLLPAEGEGRNAVYAASAGWVVDAFDYSESAKEKAEQLAKSQGVSFNYEIAEVQQFIADGKAYDAIGLIYAHQPSAFRFQFHQQLVKALKPGGYVILECFRPEQIPLASGGPKSLDLLYTKDILEADFNQLQILEMNELTTVLQEGAYHAGEAEVIRMLARKA